MNVFLTYFSWRFHTHTQDMTAKADDCVGWMVTGFNDGVNQL